MYCAPEVYFDGHRRGRKADVFSLGCVFLEMTTVLSGASLQNFHSFRRQGDKSAYAVNLSKVLQWMAYLDVRSNTDPYSTKASYARYWAFIMLDPEAGFRPSSQELVQGIQNKHYDFGGTGCGSCNPLVPNTRLRSMSPAELMDLANAETGEDVLNGPFELTWEQARTKCLSREKWVGESLPEPSPPAPPPPPPPAVEVVRELDPSWGSEAVPLPLRFNAAGHGLNMIQQKDIVALMDRVSIL
jgi:serine/threonine protein kinase